MIRFWVLPDRREGFAPEIGEPKRGKTGMPYGKLDIIGAPLCDKCISIILTFNTSCFLAVVPS